MLGPMMKSCRSGLWPEIDCEDGSMEMEPEGKVTLDVLSEPMTEARVAWIRT